MSKVSFVVCIALVALVFLPQSYAALSFRTDKQEYGGGDILYVSGKANPDTTVVIDLIDPLGGVISEKRVTAEHLQGRFSVVLLTFPPSPDSWMHEGEYTVRVTAGAETASFHIIYTSAARGSIGWEIAKIKDELANLNATTLPLSVKIEGLNKHIEDLATQIDNLKKNPGGNMTSIQNQIDSLELELSTARSKLDGEINTLLSSYTQLAKEVKEVEAEAVSSDDLQSKVNSIEGRVNQFEGDIFAVTSAMAGIRSLQNMAYVALALSAVGVSIGLLNRGFSLKKLIGRKSSSERRGWFPENYGDFGIKKIVHQLDSKRFIVEMTDGSLKRVYSTPNIHNISNGLEDVDLIVTDRSDVKDVKGIPVIASKMEERRVQETPIMEDPSSSEDAVPPREEEEMVATAEFPTVTCEDCRREFEQKREDQTKCPDCFVVSQLAKISEGSKDKISETEVRETPVQKPVQTNIISKTSKTSKNLAEGKETQGESDLGKYFSKHVEMLKRYIFLHDNPGLGPKALAKEWGISADSASSWTLPEFLRRGLVYRKGGKYYPTDEGKKYVAKVRSQLKSEQL